MDLGRQTKRTTPICFLSLFLSRRASRSDFNSFASSQSQSLSYPLSCAYTTCFLPHYLRALFKLKLFYFIPPLQTVTLVIYKKLLRRKFVGCQQRSYVIRDVIKSELLLQYLYVAIGATYAVAVVLYTPNNNQQRLATLEQLHHEYFLMSA